jgi:hypothetical protein
MRIRSLLISIALAACGGSVQTNDVHQTPELRRESQEQTPYTRAAALPPAPRAVIELDIAALRGSVVHQAILSIMEGRQPANVMGRRIVEHTDRALIGLYGDTTDVVVIASGSLDNVVEEAVAEIGDVEEPPMRLERSGFVAYQIAEDMMAAQTSESSVVLASQRLFGEVLRTASGQEPASPLPPEMRALRERPGAEQASMRLLFRANREQSGSDPVTTLVREAGFAGIFGRIEAGRILATAWAEIPTAARAAQIATDLRQMLGATVEGDMRSGSLATAVRDANVTVEDRWIRVELAFADTDLDAFMEIVADVADID